MVERFAGKILTTNDGAGHEKGSVYAGKLTFPVTLAIPLIDKMEHPSMLVRHSQQKAKGLSRARRSFFSV